MAAPAVKFVGTPTASPNSTGTNGTNITLPRHATIAAGDTLIAVFSRRSASAAQCTPPSGWSLLTGNDATVSDAAATGANSTGYRVEAYILPVATGSEAASFTWTAPSGRNWAGVILTLEGIKTGSSFTVVSKSSPGTDHPITADSVTAIGDSLLIYAAATTVGSGYTESTALYTERADIDSSSTGTSALGVRFFCATGSKTGAGATSVGSFDKDNATGTVNNFAELHLALLAVTANLPPTVTASTATPVVTVGNTATMTAVGADQDGTIASYSWAQRTTGSDLVAPALTNANTASASFTPSVAGAYTFDVTVTDNGGLTASTSVSVMAVAPQTRVLVRESGKWRPHRRKVNVGGTFV